MVTITAGASLESDMEIVGIIVAAQKKVREANGCIEIPKDLNEIVLQMRRDMGTLAKKMREKMNVGVLSTFLREEPELANIFIHKWL